MNEEQVRALVRKEIMEAFASAALMADTWHCGYGVGELESAAGRVVESVAEKVAEELKPVEPAQPVNPFAPKRTAQQWTDAIRELIRQAKDDGCVVWFDRDPISERICLRTCTETSDGHNDTIVWSDRD